MGKGRVSIVGAGPGDPELITVRGLRRVQQADVLAYDRLVHPSLAEEAPSYAERIFVGKAAGRASMEQREIEEMLIAHARFGRHVVRLKGGDPFVFGRGGEEVLALTAAGIPVELVPGVTSAIAAPAAAGIPVTHRGVSSSFTVVTGHQGDSAGELDWDWLARTGGTLVVLMGLGHIADICRRLLAGGMAAGTPAAIVSNGTTESQRVVTASLATLPRTAAAAKLASPALIVVGDVVALGSRMSLVNPMSELEATLRPLVQLAG